MRRCLVICLLLGGCAKGPDVDLQYIKEARSLAAEWAMVNEQASAGQVNKTYARSMRVWLHDGLQTAATSLTDPRSRYGDEMRALLAQQPDASPAELRAHVAALKQIEDQLESA
jgi:hypothetical protein